MYYDSTVRIKRASRLLRWALTTRLSLLLAAVAVLCVLYRSAAVLYMCRVNACQYYLGPTVLTRRQLAADRAVLNWQAATRPVIVDRSPVAMADIERLYPMLLGGGSWRPAKSTAEAHSNSKRTAVIVPYRNRLEHLHVFLRHMHAYLQLNNISYTIFVIHQMPDQTFNRAKLMNVGFALLDGSYDCVVMHDVDLLPATAGVPYNCSQRGPLHMIGAMDVMDDGLMYKQYFGGVLAATTEQWRRLNGMSNNYWGWGGEDDDIFYRVTYAGLRALRLPPSLGRYSMAVHKHVEEEENLVRYNLLSISQKMWPHDGLNSLKYTLLNTTHHALYTEHLVDLLETETLPDVELMLAKYS